MDIPGGPPKAMVSPHHTIINKLHLAPIHTSLAHLHVKPPIVIAEVCNKRNLHDPAPPGQDPPRVWDIRKGTNASRTREAVVLHQNFSWEIGYSTSDNQGPCCERANFLLAKTRREGEKRLSKWLSPYIKGSLLQRGGWLVPPEIGSPNNNTGWQCQPWCVPTWPDVHVWAGMTTLWWKEEEKGSWYNFS